MEKYTVTYVRTLEEFISLFDKGCNYFYFSNTLDDDVINELKKRNDLRSRMKLATMLKDKKERFNLASELLNEGHNEAYGLVGAMYLYGIGCQKDLKKAYELLTTGHLQGDDRSSFYLAIMYYGGLHVKEDKAKAIKIFEKLADEKRYVRAACFLVDHESNENPENYDYIHHYLTLANEIGSLKSLYVLGIAYYSGVGMPHSYAKAMEIFENLVEKEYRDAFFTLGVMYSYGYGCEQDYYRAFELYKRGAELGQATCCYNTAISYQNGHGCDKDDKKALEWFLKAAEKGDEYAYALIGDIYYNGKGVPVDYEKALEWYSKAGKEPNPTLLRGLGDIYYQGLGGVEQNYYKAIEYYREAADKGSCSAQFKYASMLENGEGVEVNIPLAYQYYSYAAIQGDEEANRRATYLHGAYDLSKKMICDFGGAFEYDVARQYYHCKEAINHYDKAFKYYQKSEEKGYVVASHMLGICYRYGRGTPLDINKAISQFKKCGLTISKLELGEIYLFGIGVKKDYALALKYLEEAGSEPLKYYYLGYMYERGLGVETDLERAFEEYEIAKLKDVKAAVRRLDKPDYQEYLEKKKVRALFAKLEKVGLYSEERLQILQEIYDYGYRGISYYLGCYYFEKKDHDYQKALDYFLEAYEYGDKHASTALGKMYLKGMGVTKNYIVAIKYIKEAAEQDEAEALFLLSRCYEHGLGVAKDIAKADKLLKKAADKKQHDALYLTAIRLFNNGEYDKAFELFDERNVKYLNNSFLYLGRIYEIKGKILKAEDAYRSAIALDDLEAYEYLIKMYIKNNMKDSAYDTYVKAIEEHHSIDAMIDLADKLYKGEFFKKNHTLSEILYKMALEKGDKRAEEALKTLKFKKSIFDRKKLEI